MRNIRIAIFLFVLFSLFISASVFAEVTDSTSLPESINQTILEGARAELANKTKYNTDMLSHYVAPVYLEGEEQARAVYPMGDVHPDEGVCTDLVVRACRAAGLDLQQMVHEAVSADKDEYGVTTPDKYIDHRRTWLLIRYFKKNFQALSTVVDSVNAHWLPGDIVLWDIGSNRHFHIGVISDKKAEDGRPLVIHNMVYMYGIFPGHTVEQDVLLGPRKNGEMQLSWKILGHYRMSLPR